MHALAVVPLICVGCLLIAIAICLMVEATKNRVEYSKKEQKDLKLASFVLIGCGCVMIGTCIILRIKEKK
jgi:uncharacterized membrane protein